MPTSYTSLIGLAKPANGELAGTWGTVVNDYLTEYVDAAVAGAQVISGSQTAVTLSKTEGASLVQAGAAGATGSSQYQIIRCTGNPASTLTITAPAANKTYLVINATSTSQSVVIRGTGPTAGVTVPSGQRAVVAWNGSDFALSGGYTAFTGDATGAGTSSVALTLANSGVTAGTYTKITVDAKGRATSGTTLSSGDLPTYTGTLISSQVTSALGYTPYNSSNPSGYITSSGRAYPRRSDGGDLNFYWSGQSGQPPWLWGGSDGNNMYVYNPSNFNVNYATTSGTSSAVTINYGNDSNGNYYMLWGSGNGVYATGGIYCNPFYDYLYASDFIIPSDERLKTDWQDLPLDFVEQLAKVKVGTFIKTDNGARQLGVTAQSLRNAAPDAVHEGADGYLSVSYANAALAACVELSKKVIELQERIKVLEGR